jgi:hypothetical protein
MHQIEAPFGVGLLSFAFVFNFLEGVFFATIFLGETFFTIDFFGADFFVAIFIELNGEY